MAEPMILEPAVEEILREVASNPDSVLLRMPRAKTVRSLFDVRPDDVQKTGLSSAEKELLRTHRNEVAWLLREVCLYKLLEGPESSKWISKYVTATETRKCIVPAVFCERVAFERGAARHEGSGTEAFELLERCVRAPLDGPPRVSELAVAAYRLEPTDSAVLMLSDDQRIGGSPNTSLRLLRTLIDRAVVARVTNSAWERIGACLLLTDRVEAAHDAFAAACIADGTAPTPWLNRLFAAVCIGDVDDARIADAELNSLPLHDVLIAHYLETRRMMRRNKEWQPSNSGRNTASALRNSLGEIGRRIADVFLEN